MPFSNACSAGLDIPKSVPPTEITKHLYRNTPKLFWRVAADFGIGKLAADICRVDFDFGKLCIYFGRLLTAKLGRRKPISAGACWFRHVAAAFGRWLPISCLKCG